MGILGNIGSFLGLGGHSPEPGGVPQQNINPLRDATLSIDKTSDLKNQNGRLYNLQIQNPELIDQSRIVDKGYNLSKDISKLCREASISSPELESQIESLKVSATRIILDCTKNIAEQLPAAGSGYSKSGLSKAKELFSKEAEFAKDMTERVQSLSQNIPESMTAITREVVTKVGLFTELAEKVILENAQVSFRNYPVGSMSDSVIIDTKTRKSEFMHDGTGLLFLKSNEIRAIDLKTSPTTGQTMTNKFGQTLRYDLTEDGRHVIQQIGMRACVASATNMMLMDHNLKPNISAEYDTNLSSLQYATKDLQRSGLESAELRIIETELSWNGKIELLTKDLEKGSGPLMLSVGSEIGGHVIILDSINPETQMAKIRDPYHGWAIETPAMVIAKRFDGSYIAAKKPQ